MKISVDKNVIEFRPENQQETTELEILWRVVVDCAGQNKKMTAIGEFIPQKENLARFVIEGIKGGRTEWSEHKSHVDGTYICEICNKYMNVKEGDDVPLCCGKEMDLMD